jgi:hypothetical protein
MADDLMRYIYIDSVRHEVETLGRSSARTGWVYLRTTDGVYHGHIPGSGSFEHEGRQYQWVENPCPRCGKHSPEYDHQEVDIGVGIQEFNHEFLCPDCGVWTCVTNEEDIKAKRSRYAFMAHEEVIVPNEKITVASCGPSTGTCICECSTGGSCEHVWDGPWFMENNMGTATCSRCGMKAIDHDIWVLP